MIAVDQLSPDALLQHARRLVGDADPGTSEHALDLRRATSSAYYAVFHELCWQAAAQVSGCPPDRRPPAVVLAHLVRWFSHAAVADACAQVAILAAPVVDARWRDRGREAWHVLRGGDATAPPDHLLNLAERIAMLRQRRHAADYDRLAPFQHDDIAAMVDVATEIVDLLREHAGSPAYRGFFVLVAMSARQRMRKLT